MGRRRRLGAPYNPDIIGGGVAVTVKDPHPSIVTADWQLSSAHSARADFAKWVASGARRTAAKDGHVLRVNIIGKSNGVGLARDLQLLKRALAQCGCDVGVTLIDRVQANRRRSWWTQLVTRAQLGLPVLARTADTAIDVNVMLEHVWLQYLPAARWNVVVPNPEWFDSNDVRFVSAVDEVWAKTQSTQAIFNGLGRHSTWIGFDSEDRYDAAVSRSRSFFHLAGKSSMKGTDRLLRVWARHPEWPTLIVVQHSAEAHAPEVRAANIQRRVGYIDDSELRELQNASMFHLCLSLTEGWGHYIVEALSVGAVTLTVDATPMNELASAQRAILVSYSHIGHQKLATTYQFDESALERAVVRALAMTDAECVDLGASARRWFLENKAQFPERLRAAADRIPLPTAKVRE